MAIELKKVQNIETLALGFNYEASIDLSTLGTTAGSATAVDIQVGGAAMETLMVSSMKLTFSVIVETWAKFLPTQEHFLLWVSILLALLTSLTTSRVKAQTLLLKERFVF